MKQLNLILIALVITILSSSYLYANTTNGGSGVLGAMKNAKALLGKLHSDLGAFPNNEVIVKNTVFQLASEYRTGALRQASRDLKSFGGDADRIGQEIEQICIDQERNRIRFDFGTDNDALALRDRLQPRVAAAISTISDFISTYTPEAANETDDQVVTGNETDDQVVDNGTVNDTDDQVVNTDNNDDAAISDTDLNLIGVEETNAIGQTPPNKDEGTTGLQHSYSNYTVKSGDSIWKIADKLSKALGVPHDKMMEAIIKANYLGKDAVIHKGQELRVPVLTDAAGNKVTGATAETALAQWQKKYEEGRVQSGADANTDQYATDVVSEVRRDLDKAYNTFYDLGCKFAQIQDSDEEAKTELVHNVRSAATTYVQWARRRYQVLKGQIKNMPQGQERDKAVSYLKRLATVGRCADNLQYAKTSGWRFEYCNQQVADLLGAAGGA